MKTVKREKGGKLFSPTWLTVLQTSVGAYCPTGIFSKKLWHHIAAFTLCFARVGQQGSCKLPAFAAVQAHMFLDTEYIPAGDSFLFLDIDAQLHFRAGIPIFLVGGVLPYTNNASSFLNFVGEWIFFAFVGPLALHTMISPGLIHIRSYT